MGQPSKQRRERLAEWVLLGGFVFLVIWPFVPVGFVVWVSGFAGAVCVVVAAYVTAPDDSPIKAMFGRRVKIEHSAERVTLPPKG